MKKIFSLILVLAVLLCLAPTAFAAGSAYWGGPSTVRAGDTISLTFYAGGGIYGGSGTVSYDSSLLTLKGYSSAIGGSWAVEFGGNRFVFYDNSMSSPISGSAAIFKATFVVNASVAPGTQISVSASGATVSDGQQDFGVGSPTYSATIAPPLSGNCNLSSMTVSGATISPAFSPSTTKYSARVPFTTSSIGVSATAEHEGAKVSVSNPGLTAGATTTVKVTVTAENGTQKTYSISVAREQDPNYVPSNNANLSALSAEGYAISPAFQKDVTQYYVWLPYEAEEISLSAEKEDGKASYSIGEYEELIPGERTDIPVTVTAEDGTKKVYTVTVVRAPAHDKVEQYISGERETEPTEPETEPTEPETEPAPTTPVVEEEPPKTPDQKMVVLIGISGLILGAGIMALVMMLTRKRKPGKYE